ncbi:G-alpha-domain-containing protein [Pluteus cervinus]|uniref:G-alpha-domain-containing protein n=1 Tax=Pluteus cervinus TaxID=181527 RepID=A0ACD3AQJ8_9AGAR|nr:G-alpha-domain-containing protein [Pluteus cervinus]
MAMLGLTRGTDNDPLARAISPPKKEPSTHKEARILAEKQAKMISDQIDEELKKERVAERKGTRALKVLILGQSESGKSTLLKNFQLMCKPRAFGAERASWRAVIQLNIVRSIHLILDALSAPGTASPRIPAELMKVKQRLSPLLQVEDTLTRKLNPTGSDEVEATRLVPARLGLKDGPKEVAVHSASGWKSAFSRLMNTGRDSIDTLNDVDWNDPNEPGAVLHRCSEDMTKLWQDPVVHQILEKRNLRIQELAGFFLDSLDRVTAPRYMPTDDDILRARLKTLGVSEHRFTMNSSSISRDWRVYDVGGQRSLRAAWIPFFDDVDAIIFLAPISCFDQVLEEDPKVNRLEDSFNLWSSIVQNPLLRQTNLILFMNKIDIMRQKLANGVMLKDYVISYQDRPNDFENASAYLMKKFGGILKQKSPVSRVFYGHLTSVTDPKSTSYIISNIRDVLMRQNLAKTSLIV